MATRRTPEEIEKIVDHCVELEQNGGDILAYLWSENYMTPRATWCNFQREWLGRKPYQYTDGKPKKERKIMSITRVKLTDEDRLETCLIAIRGGDPRKHLEQLGSSDPQGTWSKVKAWCADKKPEVYAKIPKRIAVTDDAPIVKISGPIVIETPEANKVEVVETPEKTLADAMAGMKDAADTFFGACEDMGLKMDAPKITKPVNYDGFEMIGVKSKETGFRYEYSQEYKMFHVTVGVDSLDLHISDWKRLLDELQKVIPILGVEL